MVSDRTIRVNLLNPNDATFVAFADTVLTVADSIATSPLPHG